MKGGECSCVELDLYSHTKPANRQQYVGIQSTVTTMCCHPLSRFGPYYIEPVIAGLDPKTFEPFICSLDLIGCPMVTEDFVVSGTCSEQMYGMCESLWEPDMVSVVETQVCFHTAPNCATLISDICRLCHRGQSLETHLLFSTVLGLMFKGKKLSCPSMWKTRQCSLSWTGDINTIFVAWMSTVASYTGALFTLALASMASWCACYQNSMQKYIFLKR